LSVARTLVVVERAMKAVVSRVREGMVGGRV
jgi:hypothetical protein